MGTRAAAGISDSTDPIEAFSEASAEVARQLDRQPDLCVAFAGAPHLHAIEQVSALIAERLAPRALIGCGAGGIVATGREIEGGPGAVVWAACFDGGESATEVEVAHLTAEPGSDPDAIEGLPEPDLPADALLVLADPSSFAVDALLERLNRERPGTPVIGGLASAARNGIAPLLSDGDVVEGGAVIVRLSGVDVLPCVSQGAMPIGPEIAITAAEGNVITELAFKPAIERLGEIVSGLPAEERAQAAAGGMLVGVVIDENRPEHERGDFLVRPIIGADRESGAIAIGERVRVGQTIRLHVRDGVSADADLREALAAQSEALGPAGAAGALLFTCNGRGAGMFGTDHHDAAAIDDSLDAPLAGFFCAGEIGPVGGRNFLHGFTATIAVFPAE